MIKKNLFVVLIMLSFIATKVISSENVYIVYKIDNKIITNFDIKNETKYLIALSPPLKTLGAKQLQEISTESLIKETIKKKEVSKYFNLNPNDKSIDGFIQDLYLRLGLNNINEYEKYLETNGLTISKIREKIEIESLWNKLIYNKYINQVNINEKLLKEKILQQKSFDNIKRYLLSEILLKKEKDIDDSAQIKKVKESVDEIGFKNTATLYSVSENAKFGGVIGWVDETSISKNILEKISTLNIGEFTSIIDTGTNLLLLKIDDIKIEKKEKNAEEEFKKILKLKKDKKLEQFSKIYFDKIRINTIINEL